MLQLSPSVPNRNSPHTHPLRQPSFAMIPKSRSRSTLPSHMHPTSISAPSSVAFAVASAVASAAAPASLKVESRTQDGSGSERDIVSADDRSAYSYTYVVINDNASLPSAGSERQRRCYLTESIDRPAFSPRIVQPLPFASAETHKKDTGLPSNNGCLLYLAIIELGPGTKPGQRGIFITMPLITYVYKRCT
jgi:hypothetical protein